MKKNIFLMFTALLCSSVTLAQQRITVTGIVSSSLDNAALAGVNVIIKGTTQGTSTDADGKFTLEAADNDVLLFSFIGYTPIEIPIGKQTSLTVKLTEDISTLSEVTIVSTGYEQSPRERVNGSFVQVDNALVNRRTGTDILSRLEDVTSGLTFNRNVAGRTNDISIRGMSTINSSAQPLVVIDNFPYDGDINTINPNDVESITVLKDAAAASIWGARAGNGVIVITTKKGSNRPMSVSLNSNLTIVEKPDLFYQSKMSSKDMIDVERMLFDKGFYSDSELSHSDPLTPAVEQMIAHRDGLLSDQELEQALTSLAEQDVRNDFSRYLYRKAVKQQYALNLNGGNDHHTYYFSAGWDKNTENLVSNNYDRLTLNFHNTWSALKDRLKFSAAIYYAETNTTINNDGPASILYDKVYPLYPYAKLKDEQGNNIPITTNYRGAFLENARQQGLLDWTFSPLDELARRDNKSKLIDYRINGNVSYQILEGLQANVLYQYWKGETSRRNLYGADSYYVRDLVNRFSSIDAGGQVIRPIPIGGILDLANAVTTNHSFRSQLNFDRTFGVHSLVALAGYEVRDQESIGSNFRDYGFDDATAVAQPVNYKDYYEQFDDPSSFNFIQYRNDHSRLVDRFISYYANATYMLKEKYSISASARVDKSNLFGVKANQRAIPLWSTGLGWTLSEESFYSSTLFPYLKLRATYGYNGNVNKEVTAFTTAASLGYDFDSGLPSSYIQRPGNPDLRWERVGIINLGLDFEMKNRRLHGSIDVFQKNGKDLIGTRPFSPATGVSTFTGNFASTRSQGLDLVLNSVNINGPLRWNTTLLFSTIKEKVTDYQTESSAGSLVSNGAGTSGSIAPFKGHPLYSIFSYAWAGLEAETGDPQILVNGLASTNYQEIASIINPSILTYYGSARPTVFGSVRNTLSWNNLSLSFNISYRLGYYFRKSTVNYATVLRGIVDHGDFADRWQKPGDELHTHVPSMPAATDFNRDMVYQYSSVLVEKGDNIRLQDIMLNYVLPKASFKKLPFTSVEFYSNVTNIGILWKAATGNIDPDFLTLKPARSVAFGARINF